jgi:hypothetical protein
MQEERLPTPNITNLLDYRIKKKYAGYPTPARANLVKAAHNIAAAIAVLRAAEKTCLKISESLDDYKTGRRSDHDAAAVH